MNSEDDRNMIFRVFLLYLKLIFRKLVQGESMKKRKFPSCILFLSGFLAGNLLPNIFWKLKWQQITLSSVYFLTTFANSSVTGNEYLRELIKCRGSLFVLTVICGFSVFGAPLAVLEIIALGVYTGVILSVSILEFGFIGGFAGMAFLLPQYLFYIPVFLYIAEQVWGVSAGIWRNRGLFPQKVGRYLLRVTPMAAVYVLGILSECYINPWIVEKMLGHIKFF